MMNNIKIRQKFLILGTIAFISLLFLGFLTFHINQQGFTNLSYVFSDFKKVQNLQSSYIEPLFELREKNLSLVMSPNENFKKDADQSLLYSLKKLDKNFKDTPPSIYEQWLRYKELLLTTREYAIKGFDEGAFMNASSPERDQFYLLVESLKTLQEQRLKDSQTTYEKAEENTNYSKFVIVFGFLFVGISSFTFDMLVIRRIIDSIEKVKSGLSHFFAFLTNPTKDENNTAIIEIDSKDELGIMANAINEQVKIAEQALREDYKLIEEATKTLHTLKEQKFGNRLTCKASTKELNTLKEVMNDMIDDLEEQIQAEISRRTNQEKLLTQQSKLAAMGNMLGNIAHQWRQPISEINAILMKIEAIARYDNISKDNLLNDLSTCYKITEHMSTTISDFQNFFKPSKDKESFNVEEACNSAVSVIMASLKFHNISLHVDVKEESFIYGYPREFAHAILNILSNAKDALVEREIENPQISLHVKKGKQFTLIKIEDNAGGISEENMERIFEPYFTTKHATQGTGIGLYMTKVIIENNMNGFVSVENSENGALFTIKLQ